MCWVTGLTDIISPRDDLGITSLPPPPPNDDRLIHQMSKYGRILDKRNGILLEKSEDFNAGCAII